MVNSDMSPILAKILLVGVPFLLSLLWFAFWVVKLLKSVKKLRKPGPGNPGEPGGRAGPHS